MTNKNQFWTELKKYYNYQFIQKAKKNKSIFKYKTSLKFFLGIYIHYK